jgi:hypothetical protein
MNCNTTLAGNNYRPCTHHSATFESTLTDHRSFLVDLGRVHTALDHDSIYTSPFLQTLHMLEEDPFF